MRHILKRTAGAALALAVLLGPALGQQVDITFVVANDTDRMEGVDGAGGFARLAGAVDSLRRTGGHVLFVHAGDAISPSLLSGIDRGEHVIDLLNAAAPDVFVPGNHEFDFGPDVFRQRMGEATFPRLAANLRGADGGMLPGFANTKTFEFDGVKVAVVGVTGEHALETSSPGDLRIASAGETALRAAEELRAAGADLVVAIGHIDRALDRELMGSGAFDLVLSGHDHDLLLDYDGRAVLAEAREQAIYVPVITVSVTVEERDGRREVEWRPAFDVIETAGVEPDAAVAAKVADYEKRLDEELNVAIGRMATELDSRRAAVRGGEAAIGNLIADAMREAAEADVAITNGGGIRGDTVYAPGTELTRRDVLTELPFGNRTVKLEVTGDVIRQALEHGLSQVEEGAGRFPQVSGMIVTADLKAPAGSRVKQVTVGGAPLDPARTYTLATNDFMARGGDGYAMFEGARELLSARDARLMANDVMAYVSGKREVAPKVEGRIRTGG
jgi:2',3'-cyclic-nucleotide 2'-phosphodiesterase (5'-nucleotidase family)